MCRVVRMLQRGHSGDVCVLASTLCKYVPCGRGAFSLEKGRIAPLPLPRHVVRGDYLECLAK